MASDERTNSVPSDIAEISPLGDRLRRLMPRVSAGARALRDRLRSINGNSSPSLTDAIDREYIKEGARRVTSADLGTVVKRADAIEKRFRDDGPLGRLLEDGRLLLGLVRDAKRGRYREVPTWTLSAAGFALLYVLNPFDLIPDALPFPGLLDDAAVVSACLALVEQDLYAYREWCRGHGTDCVPGAEEDSPETLTSG